MSTGFTGNKAHLASFHKEIHNFLAGEDIGIFTHAQSGNSHPLSPLRASGHPLYIVNASNEFTSENISVKKVTNLVATTKLYCGIAEQASTSGLVMPVRIQGDVYMKVGKGIVTAGDLVILDCNSTENSNGATAGDVIKFDEANDAYGTNTLAAITLRLRAFVGFAYNGGAARTDADTFNIIRVRLRGY